MPASGALTVVRAIAARAFATIKETITGTAMSMLQQLTAALRRSARPTIPTEDTPAQTARLAERIGTFAEHPSKGLTPNRLHTILEEAEGGDITAQAQLFVDCEEKDGHIFAEMSKRKRALLGLDWSITPPKTASAAERTLADTVAGWLDGIDDLEDVFFDLLDALGHGFAALELAWAQVDGVWLPRRFDHRPQGWFTLRDDQLLLRRAEDQAGEPLWPYGWLLHTAKARSGLLARGGLMRSLVWPYLFKNYSVRDLAEFLEIYGLPVRIGKYPPGATEQEKTTLLKALASIGHNAAGIFPDGMAVELLAAANGRVDPYQSMTDWCERTESKIILGGTLTAQADGKTSTYALGNIHNEVRHDLLVSDARQLAATLTRGLIGPILELNRPGIDPRRMPALVFDIRQPEDLAVYAESLPKLVSVGLPIPVDWARDKLAIPAPLDDEDILQPTQNAPSLLPAAARQETQEPRTAALSAEKAQALTAQQALDAALAALPEAYPAQLEPLITPLAAALASGANYTEIQSQLIAGYPDLDTGAIREALARVLFVSDIWGQIHGRR